MNRPMRRKDRQLSPDAAMRILQDCPWGVLSTVGEDGLPYGVPVNYVMLDGAIYVHCAKAGRKLDNIRHCPHVSFVAISAAETLPADFATAYMSAIVSGAAHEVDGDEKLHALQAFIEKFSPEYSVEGAAYIARAADATAVLRIDIEEVTGKARKKPE